MYFNLNASIENGRKFAYGIGCDADLVKAYECWAKIEGCLSEEDRQSFHYIKEIIQIANEDDEVPSFDWGDTSAFIQIAAKKATAKYSESHVRELFEELLSEASAEGNFNSLYSALKKYKDSKKEKSKEKKPENIRFGNNLGLLIQVFWGSKQNLFNKMNNYFREKGFKELKSIQQLYYAINGTNGLGDTGKEAIVEMANELNLRRKVLSRPLTIKDLDLSHDEFLKLFSGYKA